MVQTGRFADRNADGIYSISTATFAMGLCAHERTRTLGSILKIREVEKSGVHLIATDARLGLTMRSMTKTPIKPIKQQMEFMEIVPDRLLPSCNETAHSACCGGCGNVSETRRVNQDAGENIQMLCDLLDLHRI